MNTNASTKSGTKAALLLGALGVVYGDIGTSPLYALQTSLLPFGPVPSHEQVLGVISILVWLLTLIVSIKYAVFILRADYNGEGGVLALMELALQKINPKRRMLFMVLGLIGASLFYGDSIITPAISVLSAIEGISIVSHTFDKWIVPLALVIITALFLVQNRGTATMGKFFGPIMLLWFVSLGAMGVWNIIKYPSILEALNPMYAFIFIKDDPIHSFFLMSAVVLAVTGAEALYADMGHFGRPAINKVWFALVYPSLILCYLGQAAVVLINPAAIKNPFYLSAPEWALIPLVVLATMATIIACQAVISGAFSVTRQAVQLGFWPRMEILHTSAQEEGQIYLPRVNMLLFISVVILIIGFRTSESLANAYGFAVTGTMLVSTILAFIVLPSGKKGLARIGILILLAVFAVLDILLFSANTLKIFHDGWIPIAVGAVVLTLMLTWYLGRRYVSKMQEEGQQNLIEFLPILLHDSIQRVPGTGIFMSAGTSTVPPALLHNLKHNKVLHEQLLFLTIKNMTVPYVSFNNRLHIEKLGRNTWQVVASYGFKQEPNVPQVLEQIAHDVPTLNLDGMSTSYFLSRSTLVISNNQSFYIRIFKKLFAVMARNAARSTRFYKIPPNRVVDMGIQTEI